MKIRKATGEELAREDRYAYARVVALIVARNEEKDICKVISALKNQTLPIMHIVFVDDGSTDNTAIIAESLGCIVIELPYHPNSLVGSPFLAQRWNMGLKKVREYSLDYVLLVGGDHVLPEDYVKEILNNMTDEIIIASGRIAGEGFRETAPRGSGRLIKASFWRDINKMQYPINYGWESWILFKAMEQGFKTRCFENIITKIERPTSLGKSKAHGKGMYALGYNWKHASGRCVLTFFKSPKAGIKMFWSWFRHDNIERLDIADFVNEMQNQRFWDQLNKSIKGKFVK